MLLGADKCRGSISLFSRIGAHDIHPVDRGNGYRFFPISYGTYPMPTTIPSPLCRCRYRIGGLPIPFSPYPFPFSQWILFLVRFVRFKTFLPDFIYDFFGCHSPFSIWHYDSSRRHHPPYTIHSPMAFGVLFCSLGIIHDYYDTNQKEHTPETMCRLFWCDITKQPQAEDSTCGCLYFTLYYEDSLILTILVLINRAIFGGIFHHDGIDVIPL